MHPSKYNVYIPVKEGTYLLYNTLTGALFFVDKELREAIQKNPSSIPDVVAQDFKKEWVILDDNIDENQMLSVMRDEMRYNSPWLQFLVMTTYDCNLVCPYCYEVKDSMTSMDAATCERTQKFIEHLVERYRPTTLDVLMYGGEPLLNVDPLFALMEHFTLYSQSHALKFRVSITTNGTLITENLVRALEAYPVDVVQVTLDGPAVLHDRTRVYRNGKGSYNDIMEGLHVLRTSALKPKIRINCDEHNKDAVPLLLDDLKERGLSDIPIYFGIIRAFSPVCESYGPSCIPDSQMKAVIPRLWREAVEKGFNVPLKPMRNLVGCGMQSNSSYTIDPEGRVYKCVTSVGYEDQCIGTINAEGDIPVWSPVYYEWMSRNPLEFSGCKACTFFPVCGGGCPMIAFARHGTHDRGGCFETKTVLGEQLKLYVEQKYPEKFRGEILTIKEDVSKGSNMEEKTTGDESRW